MKKKTSVKMKKQIAKLHISKVRVIIFLVLSCLICSTFLFAKPLEIFINDLIYSKVSTDVSDCELKVHFIDVGQGDSILVEFPDQKVMLVDCGPKSSKNILLSYLNNFFSTRINKNIDYFIVTHQDEDHIGGAEIVFDNFDILKFYRPSVYTDEEMTRFNYSETEVNVCNTQVFKTMINKMYEENCTVLFNMKDINPLGLNGTEDYKVEFLSPKDLKYSDANNYSPVTIITYQNRKIMLTGDAEALVETQILNDYSTDYLSCDILKLGHHGSNTSTTKDFLDAVNPKYVAISCGINNKYNHPNETILARVITKVGESNVYRTDKLGNIIFGLDKDNLISGKAEIKIAHSKGQIIQFYIQWWYIVICFEGIIFVVIFLPKYQFSIPSK